MNHQPEPLPVLASTDRMLAVTLGVSVGYPLGAEGDYRLLTGILGNKQITLYEAVSGTDRYPPGRNMHVTLSFEECDRLIEAYQRFRETQERRAYAARQSSDSDDDFDPFLDPDDLP